MNCERVQNNLDAYIDEALDAETIARMRQHLGECDECAESLEQHQAFRVAMRSVEIEAIDPSTAARLLRKAQLDAENICVKQERRTSFFRGAAAAAFIAAFIGLGSNILPKATQDSPAQSVAAINTVQEVQVIIYVPESMNDATIALELPQELSVDGYDGVRTLAWNTDLDQGANQLTLPLRLSPGSDVNQIHSIVANIEYNNEVKSFELKVDLSGNKKKSPMTIKPVLNSINQSA